MEKDEKTKSTSFWTTVPGLLTAFAAIITAIGGLIGILHTAGIIGPGQQPKDGPLKPPPGPSIKVPTLLVPQNGSQISQPFVQPWVFKWEEPREPGSVRQYRLMVFGPLAPYPVTDVLTGQTEHGVYKGCSYIIDRNRMGWRWKVRPQFSDGTWGEWSKESTFDVSPLNIAYFCQKCPSAESCKKHKERKGSP